VGCVGRPETYHQSASVAPDTAYTCASHVIDSLGYTVQASDKSGGFLRATRQRSGLFSQDLDVLTLKVAADTAGKAGVSVTAGGDALREAANNATARVITGPSGRASDDAHLVLSRCAGV
jgi:hypothetical protein